jgi:hypothetical protein
MSLCRYGNDINKIIHFEKNWKNVARKLQRFCSVYFPGVKKYCRLCSVQPEKSKRQYDKCYNDFKERCNKNNVKTVSENVVLAYLMEKSKTVKSSTLWSTAGYQAKKSKVLTRDQIDLLYNLPFFRSF